MSMYKTIFVTETDDQNAAGEKILSVNGEIALTGESAFTSLEQAVAAVQKVASNAIVIKVASGKYEEFVVINEGVAVKDVTVVAVDFNGGDVVIDGNTVTVDKSGLTKEAQATVLADLNDKNAAEGKIFVAADAAPAGTPTLYVGVDSDNNYVVGAGSSTVVGNDISSLIENLIKNPVQQITGSTTPDLSTGSDTPSQGAMTDTPASTPADSTPGVDNAVTSTTPAGTALSGEVNDENLRFGQRYVAKDTSYIHKGGNLWGQNGSLYVEGYMYYNGGRSVAYFGTGAADITVTVTVDGTYAADGNDNGKFVNDSNQAIKNDSNSTLNVVNGGLFSWNGNVTNNGVIDVDGSTLKVDANNDGRFDNNGTLTADSAKVTVGAYLYNTGKVDVDGSTLNGVKIENKGTFTADDSIITLDRFEQASTEAAVFNNSEISIGDLDTGSAGHVIVGGASKVNIGNVYGGNALRLGKNAVILNGSKISGSVAARALGNVTFGETSTDEVTVSRFDTKFIDGDTVTVNGTLTVDGYCFGMVGRKDYAELNLDGYGTIDLYQNLFLEGYQDANGDYTGDQANITVGENITINMLEKGYQGHLRFTYADVTVKGSIVAVGKDIDRALLDKANVTVTGSKGKLDIADDVWVGYSYVYDYRDEGKNNYKSTLSITDKAYFKVGDELRINTGSEVNVENAVVEANNVLNKGTLNITSADFTANKVSGDGTFNIGASVDKDGNAIATKLQIDSLEQDVKANENGTDPVALTGSINTGNKFRVYGDATLDNFNVNGDYAGQVVSAQGQVLTYGDTVISGNSKMNLNYFQATAGVVLEAGSTISTANMNLYDKVADSDFVVKGTVNACTLILVNDYYNAGSGSELIIAKDGVVNGLTQNDNGRFDIQAGNMTVQGYVNGTWGANGGSAYVGNSGLPARLTVDGIYASDGSNNGKFVNNGTQTLTIGTYGLVEVINGAEFSWNSTVTNKGTVTVDADSKFFAANIVNTGKFNSEKDGEMVVLADMTIAGNINTDTLILKSGAVLEAGSLTVDNLTLSIGSTLALSGAKSTVESITVVGDIVPSNSEFTLITTGWDTILTASAGKPSISYKGNKYTVVDYNDSLKGLQFITVGSNLYVKDFGANVTGIYIGELVEGLKDGEKITDETGATYTVGKDAFASIDEALASDALKEAGAKDKVTSVILDSNDKLSNVAEQFQNLKEVEWQIEAGPDVSDTASFNGNLNLKNDGHLDAKITITGDFNFTNTSKQTLVGEYTAYTINGINTGAMSGTYVAEDKIVIDNTNGIIGEDGSLTPTYLDGSQVEITGGDAYNVSVNAGSLALTDTNSFELNADSSVLLGKENIWIPADQKGILGAIFVNGGANLTISGDNDSIGADIENVNHTGTVTFNGKQTYTGDLAANKFVVAAGKEVTVNSNQFDFNELAIAGTLKTDFTSQDSFTKAGAITGAGSFITTHEGAWIINDSVERDFSKFTGFVSMEQANASIVMGKGDAIKYSNVSSYFANDTTVTIDGSTKAQSVVLAKTGVNTAINFVGDGTINVGNYEGAFAKDSDGFTQTLSGANTGFTGDINVSEGAALTLESAIGATAINLDAPSTAATGDTDDTKLILNVADAAVNAKITGDTNDIIDVNADQKLDAAEALNNFHGEVALEGNTVTLNGANETSAQFISANGTINANANQTLSGDNSTFTGDLNIADGAAVTLKNNMGATTIDLGSSDKSGTATLNLDKAGLSLNADISGEKDDEINVVQNAALGATKALNDFHGTVKVNSSTLDLNGANETDAKFTSDANAGVINANADQTLSGDNSGFTGDINVAEGKALTLENAMGAKSINLDKDGNTSATGEVDATKLNLNSDNLSLKAVITGDDNDVVNVQKNASLETAEALNDFHGTVKVNSSTLDLNGANETDAVFTSDAAAGVINANADQTFSGDNSGFTGDINVAEGKALTLENAMGAKSINLDKDGNTSATGEVDATKLNLNSDNLALKAVITGDANDEINVQKSATLTGDNSGFKGDVTVEEGKTLTLQGNMGAANIDLGTDIVPNPTTLKLEKDGLELGSKITGDADDVINVNESATLSGDNSNFKGDVNVKGGETLTLKEAMGAATIDLSYDATTGVATLNLEKDQLVLGSKITGDADDIINVKESVTLTADNSGFKGDVNIDGNKALTITDNLGADTVNFKVNSNLNVTKDAVIDSKFVSTDPTDTTANVTISAGISATLSALNALNGFTGTVNTGDATSKLILNDKNNTAATITGSGIIDANADQIFSGNVSGFGGIYDIETSVTLSGDLADVINAQGNTLKLENTTKEVVTINSTDGYDLDNLEFGINDIKLGTGDTDDFTNVKGSGDILDFGLDQTFDAIEAGNIFVDSADQITAESVDADINITINGFQNITDKADVTITGGNYDDVIRVNVDYKTTYLQGGYRLVTSTDFTENDTIVLTVTNYDDNVVGEESVNTIKVDNRVVIEGKTYLLQLKENTLILTELPGYSNYVAIDGSWSGRVPYQAVDDEGKERIVGYDAASLLDDAVGYIKGYDKGINANAGTNMGDATMELMDGAYKLVKESTLMTDDNGVTQLILKGRDGNEVIISGTLRGSDGSKETSLVIENIRTTGYVFGGGDLTIKNSASIRTSGNAIAAGIANQDANNAQTMMFDTNLTINGGYFSTTVLTGGSVAFGGNVEVNGETSVVINNTTDETLTITGNIFGGSYAADGKVTQNSDAYVLVNATNATTLRGNIYVSGFQSGKVDSKLVMNGNSYITFTGAAANLNFTGTVSAIQSDKAEIATFKSFKGQFNGSLIGFDSITISGDTNLSLGRRQTETANTGLTFTVNSQTQAMAAGQTNVKAMYTVRDSNAWEFSKQIVIDTNGSGAAAGTSYLIVDNYAGGFDGFTFIINGQNYGSLEAAKTAGLSYNATTGQLIYELTDAASRVDLDVDAVLNGDFSAATGNLNVTGIKDLHTDNFGVKAIVTSDTTSVDSILANATIEGMEYGKKIYQLADADTNTISTDDVWAGLGKDASGDVLVVWGDSEQFVSDTLTEFGGYDLNLGDTYTVSNPLTSPEDNTLFKDEYKKNGSNGTLA